jgi:hypothetical protein
MMSPSDETTQSAAATGTTGRQTPRFAFAPNLPAPSVTQVNGNVAAVLYFLATVMYDPEHPVTLTPLAADGLCHILDAAHHDLMDAAEFRSGSV